MNPVKIIDLEGMVNLNDPTHTERNANFRKQFSTEGFFFKDKNGNTNWNHEKFDMFGFGKTIEELFKRSDIHQCYDNTIYS